MDLKYLLTNQLFQLAPRNIDACIVDGMFLVHSHANMPLNFGGQANVNSRSRHDLRPKIGDDCVFATYNSNSESCPMYLHIS